MMTEEEKRLAKIAYVRKWQAANAEHVREYQKKRRVLKREEDRACKKAYYARKRAEDIDLFRANDRARHASRFAAKPNDVRVANARKLRNWRKRNPEAVRLQKLRRRTRQAEAEGCHTVTEWHEKLKEYGNTCAYCPATANLVREHVVPLSRGGSNSIINIVPACRSCNSKKRIKIGDGLEWPVPAQQKQKATS